MQSGLMEKNAKIRSLENHLTGFLSVLLLSGKIFCQNYKLKKDCEKNTFLSGLFGNVFRMDQIYIRVCC